MSTSTPRLTASLSAAIRCESGEKYAVCNRIRCREERMSAYQTVRMSFQPMLAEPHDLNRCRTRLRLVRETVTLVVEGAPGLGPVLDEGRGQAVDRWPLHPEVRIPPLVLVAGVAPPLLGNPHSAGEPDGFVDNAHLAMTTMVLLEGRIQPELAVPVHIDARVLHSLDDPVLDLDTSEGVDEDPHPQPCPGPVTQRVCDLLSGPALPVHKGHEVDGVLCLPDCLEYGREDLIAVAENRDRVAFSEVNSDKALQRTTQLPSGVLTRLRRRVFV